MKTHALIFPFDLFGHSGARDGAELLGDAVREMLHDNRRERKPTRARAYTSKILVDELLLDTLADYAEWRTDAAKTIANVLAKNDFLVWATGNHLGVLPLYDVLDEETLVLQFDAHLDVYDLSDSTPDLSHGNFVRQVKGPKIVNLGHREQVLRPDAIAEFFDRAISAEEMTRDRAAVQGWLKEKCAAASRIVIDVDCDVFDAAYFPAVAQPEPFGLSPAAVLGWLADVWSPKVKALAISEFLPSRDDRDRSLATLLWLVEWVFLRNHERRSPA